MSKKKSRKRSTGWAWTKSYPHANHPATYKRKKGDDIEYITFTHSQKVDFDTKEIIYTVPLSDNISPAERRKNKQLGIKPGENRSYAYPKVYDGKRSALWAETSEFDPTDADKKHIERMFAEFPHEKVPTTGGKGHYRKKKAPKKK